jgi:hypothetical protein
MRRFQKLDLRLKPRRKRVINDGVGDGERESHYGREFECIFGSILRRVQALQKDNLLGYRRMMGVANLNDLKYGCAYTCSKSFTHSARAAAKIPTTPPRTAPVCKGLAGARPLLFAAAPDPVALTRATV